MKPTEIFSLTPDFSRVLGTIHQTKPFQRFFSEWVKAVETTSSFLGPAHTRLKPGVNDIAISLASYSL